MARVTFALVTTLLMVGCPRPPKPLSNPLGGGTTFVGENLEPMIVDWNPENRGDLEVSMRDGLVVVAFDQRGFRILKDCRVDGSYEFMGMTRREHVVRLESEEEIRANLPLAGAGLAAQLGGDLSQGQSLDIAMIMVGKVRSTRRQIAAEQLVGRCQGATHVVRGATVGAFAMDTGDRTRARAAAEIFSIGASGSSTSSRRVRTVDGVLTDCERASPDSAKAPRQCGALLRIELLPIGRPQDERAAERSADLRDSCTPPLQMVDGKCTRAQPRGPAECVNGDARGCQALCDAGNAKSCSKMAWMLIKGDGVAKKPERATPFAARACDTGDPMGCTLLGDLITAGAGVQRDLPRAARAFLKGCNDGSAEACGRLGNMALTGTGISQDPKLAAQALDRACKGGYHGACSDFGLLALGGQGFSRDWPLAARLFKRACEGDSSTGCSNLAYMVEFGQGVNRDPNLATKLYAHSCKLDASSCMWFGAMLHMGKGVSRDESQAVSLYRRSCNAGDVVACALVRGYLDPSQRVDAERMQAYVNVWKGTCEGGIARDCSGIGILAQSLGRRDDARALLQKGCSMGDDWGCLMSQMRPR